MKIGITTACAVTSVTGLGQCVDGVQEWVFRKVPVTTNTVGDFLLIPPTVRDGVVAFMTYYAGGTQRIYTLGPQGSQTSGIYYVIKPIDLESVPVLVASSDGAAPGPTDTFFCLCQSSIGGFDGRVFFPGYQRNSDDVKTGIFYRSGGEITDFVIQSTNIAGHLPNVPIGYVSEFAVGHGSNAAAIASQGIYHVNLGNGVVSKVYTHGVTELPGNIGNGLIYEFGIAADADVISFAAGNPATQHSGIYRVYGVDGVTLIADSDTTIPGTNQNFSQFSSTTSISGTRVAFRGQGQNATEAAGIYIGDGNGLTVVADLNTPVPGRDASFTDFHLSNHGAFAFDGNRVMFAAQTSDATCLYMWEDGVLTEVLKSGDLVPGTEEVSFGFDFGSMALDGDVFVMNDPLGHSMYVGALVETAAGDYNGNGIVDAADYSVWRDNLGATGQPGAFAGDGTTTGYLLGVSDGVVDEWDYNLWKFNFGTTITAGVAANAFPVPSPSSHVLAHFVLTIAALSCPRTRRAARTILS